MNCAETELLCQLKDVNGASHSVSAALPSHELDEPPKKWFSHLSKIWSKSLKKTGKDCAATAPQGEQELEQYLQSAH